MTRSAVLLAVCALASSHAASSDGVVTLPLVPHHAERQRRGLLRQPDGRPSDDAQLRRRDSAQQVGALYQGYGTHYVDLWCGTPPQRQTVIVDTGSSVTAFPCAGCQDCGVPDNHIDRLFEPAESLTFSERSCSRDGCLSARSHCSSNDVCTIHMSYAEGSKWNAYEVKDRCYIGGSHVVPLLADSGTDDLDPKHASYFATEITFGCETSITGLFKTQLADGIMGMSNNKGTYWHQMFATGKMGNERQFALCFARQPYAERSGTEAGAITLGGVDPRLHHGDMVYTGGADNGRSGFFSVKVRNIYLREGKAGESAQSRLDDPTQGVSRLDISEDVLNKGGIIVDSGTTDTYWNRNIATDFKTKFKQLTGMSYDNRPLKLSKADLDAMPTVLFQLHGDNTYDDPDSVLGLAGSLDPEHPNDVILAFPPSHYMEYDAVADTYTPRFYPTENGGSVLGANAMMGHDVLFDIDNNRLGWAESNCDFTQIVQAAGFKSIFDPSVNTTISKKPKYKGEKETEPKEPSRNFARCDSTCRGMYVAGVVVVMFLVVFVTKSMSSPSPTSIVDTAIRRTEMEMGDMDSSEFSTYKDTPGPVGNGSNGFSDYAPDDESEFDGDFRN